MKPSILVVLLIVGGLFSACRSSYDFSRQERQLIRSGSDTTAFRVLSIINPEDSVILRTPSRDFRKIKNNKDLALLLKRMQVTMDKEEGIGIAAPQIGINRNIFLFTRAHEKPQKVQVAINPELLDHAAEKVCFQRDGCLSVPDLRGNSLRYDWIKVRYTDELGVQKEEKFSDHVRPENFTGIIFQHEFDHIRGILLIDKRCE